MILLPKAFAIASAILSILNRASCHPVKYDQRQEGDLNIRTDVEDVVFVVIPPKDLISTGMNIVAATAANFLKNSYGSSGIERWPLRSPSKVGFAPVEKSPYKIDLEGQKMNVKKINSIGDTNRYNFHENKNPGKGVTHIDIETKKDSMMKPFTSTTSSATTITTTTPTTAKIQESTTESKIEEKKNIKADEKKEPLEEEKMKAKPFKKTVETKTKAESPVVVGEFSEGGLGPESIFTHEGCGPEAHRDQNGLCVYQSVNKKN